MEIQPEIKRLELLGSFAIYIPASVLVCCLLKNLIPYLSVISGQETILFWFIVSGLSIFTPLIITGLVIIKYEEFKIFNDPWVECLRFRKLTVSHCIWSLTGLIFVE
jgi:hypothetical protein